MLEFGTAGIRGILGNKKENLNKKHVYRIIDGYARYLLKYFPNVKKDGIVIGRDNRNMSFIFLKLAAKILAKNYKIKVYSSKIPLATPFISYATKKLRATGAINITASHNPKEYNGIKLYNQTGAQILPNEVKLITPFFKNYHLIKNNLSNKKISFDNKRVINIDYLIDKYVKDVSSILGEYKNDKKIEIAFSPLHGTGSIIMPKIEKMTDIKVHYVKEEMKNSKFFHYAFNPNPEVKSAYDNLIKLMENKNLKYGLVSDPDADRVGLVEKLDNNEFYYFTGNELATIIFNQLVEKQYFKNTSALIYSFVSTNLPAIIAQKNNLNTEIIPTGFKWVGPKIDQYLPKTNNFQAFAFEESYGSLIDYNISYDKDAFQSIIAVIKMLQENSKLSFYQKLQDIYRKYGYVKSKVISINFNTFDKVKLNEYLNNFKSLKFELEIDTIIDYRKGYKDINPENMIQIFFKNKSWVSLRPSGTEPKIKLYIFSINNDEKQAEKILRYLEQTSYDLFK
ncbi:phospho-sugar mutase [Mesomycoplasma lagogenitalium]|uniref:Phospho-sugar mutase n=1 Tax=Mesomycoplasma lagogenitalium TaxID=171286 RepID=A0ABY8LTH6_9BACT|nr:phospho-sugar mutase [Mesomycoplasma lagogenitalium]WGI36544.1 phospho-sugar mutase [Mesomycoplasma lagogenitalium]